MGLQVHVPHEPIIVASSPKAPLQWPAAQLQHPQLILSVLSSLYGCGPPYLGKEELSFWGW